MADVKLQSLIDRVIGKDGILRVPAYWMRRILGKLMEYSDKTAESQAKQALADAKTYADDAVKANAPTGDELKYYTLPAGVSKSLSINVTGTVDSYTFTDEEAAEWKKYYASPDDRVVRILMSDGLYMNASSSTLKDKSTDRPTFRFYWAQPTSWFISEGKWLHHILEIQIISESGNIRASVMDLPCPLPLQVDSSMSTTSIQPVQNKVIKAYVDSTIESVAKSYEVVSVTAPGLAPKLELNGNSQKGDWILSSINGAAPTWKRILTQVESGTKDALAYYSDANTVASFDEMVGHTGQPVFINNGVPTPISESIGDAHTPIYMDKGQFYPITGVRLNQYLYDRSGYANQVQGNVSLTASNVLDRQIYILYDGANLTLPEPSSELVGAIIFVKNAYGDSSKVTGKIVGSSQTIAEGSTRTITLADNHSGFFLCVVYGNNFSWVHFYCS